MFAMEGLSAIRQLSIETTSSDGKVSEESRDCKTLSDINSWHVAGQEERARRRSKPPVLVAKSSVFGFSLDAGVASGTSSMTWIARFCSANIHVLRW